MLVGLEKIHNEVQLHKSVCRPFLLTQQPVSTLKVSLKLRVCSYNIVYKITQMN